MVTFERGARAAWHKHPAGQILMITAGRGWAQREDVTSGDTVCFPRARNTGTRHGNHRHEAYRLTEAVDGNNAEWMEHVSDDYNRG